MSPRMWLKSGNLIHALRRIIREFDQQGHEASYKPIAGESDKKYVTKTSSMKDCLGPNVIPVQERLGPWVTPTKRRLRL